MGAKEILVGYLSGAVKWVLNKLDQFFKWVFGFLRGVWEKIAARLPNSVVQGIRTFTAKIGGIIKNVSKSYVMDKATGRFKEIVQAAPVPQSEVPAWALQMADGQEVEKTEELVNQLSS